MRHLFIVNPIAGGRDRTEEISAAAAEIFQNGGDYEVYVTKAPGDAAEKVRREAEKGDELRVYSIGGDGTLNECVNGAALRRNVAVAVYPSGTGNDFARMFGGEKRRLLDLRELVDGTEHSLDLIECAGRYGVNICCVGVDARIGTQVHRYSELPLVGGKLAYISSVAVNFLRGITGKMRVRFGSRVIDGRMTLVCACNGSFYGGGFNPFPDARPDDGALDFLIIRGVSRAKFVGLIGKYAAGKWSELPEKYCIHYRGSELTVESENEECISVDGEELYSRKVTFRVVPAGIRFIFPAGLEYFAPAKE